MSKAAVVNLTQSMAAYFANAKIRINAVAPGFIVNERSKLILGTPEDGLTARGQSVMNHTPMYRFGNPEDLLGCVSWLLNDEGKMMQDRPESSPICQYDDHYSFDPRRGQICYVWQISRDAVFEDLFLRLRGEK